MHQAHILTWVNIDSTERSPPLRYTGQTSLESSLQQFTAVYSSLQQFTAATSQPSCKVNLRSWQKTMRNCPFWEPPSFVRPYLYLGDRCSIRGFFQNYRQTRHTLGAIANFTNCKKKKKKQFSISSYLSIILQIMFTSLPRAMSTASRNMVK